MRDLIDYLTAAVVRRGKPRPYGNCQTRQAASLPKLSDPSSQQLFGRQQLVHRPGAESFQVEGYKLEPKSFEHGRELAGHFSGQSAWKFFGRNLNSHRFPVMAHAELPEAHGPQRAFSPLNYIERFGRDRASIFQAGGKAVSYTHLDVYKRQELMQDEKLRQTPSHWPEESGEKTFPGGRSKILFVKDTARVSEVNLEPGATVPSHHHDGPHLLVAISDLDPVSYTHLDVYKRQLLECIGISFPTPT